MACPWGRWQRRGSPASSTADAGTENELRFLLQLSPQHVLIYAAVTPPGFLFPRCLKGFITFLLLLQGIYHTLLADLLELYL